MLENRRKLGLMIRQIRLKSGLDLKGFAEKVGVSKTAAAKWETFRTIPTHAHREKIARLALPVARGSDDLEKECVRRKRLKLMEEMADAAFSFSLTYKRRAHLMLEEGMDRAEDLG